MIKARINKQVAAVGIFTVVLMVMWFVFFIGLCSSLGYLGFSTSHFKVMSDFNFATKTGPMILFVLICLFVLFALVKSIKATKRHKNTAMVWASFVIMLIGAFIALELFFNLTRSVQKLGYVYILSDFDHPTRVLMSFGTIASGALAWILSIILWAVVIAENAGKLQASKLEKSDEEQQQELEQLVRRLVIEEIEKRPQVTQNFYGVGPEKPLVEKVVVQEVKQAVQPQPQVIHVVQQAPAPAPQPVEDEEKNKIIRIPFDERLIAAEKGLKDNYNELKNEILSYGVKSRISNSGDTFRLHRKTFVKITIAGKGLKLYFALRPSDYATSTIPVIDVSDKGVYEETPLAFKVKSDLSVKRAKQLIADVMATENLEQGEVGKDDFVKPIRALLKAENRL